MLLARLTSRGPVIDRQQRPGQGGHDFTIYKIRTI
jgi:lipopolysaccharide/colanic/teichoic acid biosynthesis glycosyltransferase